MSIVDAGMYTDFVVRIAYEIPERVSKQYFSHSCQLTRIITAGNSRRLPPSRTRAVNVQLTTIW